MAVNVTIDPEECRRADQKRHYAPLKPSWWHDDSMPPFVDRPEGTDWAREFELWEHQGRALTAGDLRRALDEVPADTPVTVEYYDGARSQSLLVVEVGCVGVGPRPSAVAVTVVDGPPAK